MAIVLQTVLETLEDELNAISIANGYRTDLDPVTADGAGAQLMLAGMTRYGVGQVGIDINIEAGGYRDTATHELGTEEETALVLALWRRLLPSSAATLGAVLALKADVEQALAETTLGGTVPGVDFVSWRFVPDPEIALLLIAIRVRVYRDHDDPESGTPI